MAATDPGGSERLSAAAATLRRLRSEERQQQDDTVHVGELQRQNRALADQLAQLRGQLDRHQKELVRVRRRLADAERESDEVSGRFVALEEARADLARLCVAAALLHARLDEREVLGAVREVVINLVGSEEFAVMGFDADGGVLETLDSMGVDAERCRRLRVGVGPLGQAVRGGRPYLRDDDADAPADAPVACVPLLLEERVTGVVVVFGLLPHKPALLPFDRELFALLSTHGGTALHAARLHAASRAALP